MRRRWGLAVVSVMVAAVCVAVARADFVLPTPHEPGPNTVIASDALNSAIKAVADADHACQLRLAPRAGAVTHDAPPQAILDAFAVLRRPATPADRFDADGLLRFADRIAVDYIRRARVLPDGTSVYVVPSLSVGPAFVARPPGCAAREREALEHRLRGKPAQAQRAARRLLRTVRRGQREAARRPPRAGLLLEEQGPHGGGGGGGVDVDFLLSHGQFGASYVRGRGSRVVGLIPDGVAKVEFTFARGHGLGPEGVRVYRTIYRRTVAVVDNVVFLTVPRMPEDALYNRQVWRAADGSVVSTIKPAY